MKIVVDWKALKRFGYTPYSFRNGCCPEMAAVIRSLIPKSDYMVGIAYPRKEIPFLSHVVVFDGVTTYDADGDDAVANWENDQDDDIEWTVVNDEQELDRMVYQHGGSIEQETIDIVKKHVKVVA